MSKSNRSFFTDQDLMRMYQSAVKISSHPRCDKSAEYVFKLIMDQEIDNCINDLNH